MVFYGFLRVSVVFYGFLRVSLVVYGFLRVLFGFLVVFLVVFLVWFNKTPLGRELPDFLFFFFWGGFLRRFLRASSFCLKYVCFWFAFSGIVTFVFCCMEKSGCSKQNYVIRLV